MGPIEQVTSRMIIPIAPGRAFHWTRSWERQTVDIFDVSAGGRGSGNNALSSDDLDATVNHGHERSICCW